LRRRFAGTPQATSDTWSSTQTLQAPLPVRAIPLLDQVKPKQNLFSRTVQELSREGWSIRSAPALAVSRVPQENPQESRWQVLVLSKGPADDQVARTPSLPKRVPEECPGGSVGRNGSGRCPGSLPHGVGRTMMDGTDEDGVWAAAMNEWIV